MSQMTNECDYLYQNSSGQLLKIVKSEIKQERPSSPEMYSRQNESVSGYTSHSRVQGNYATASSSYIKNTQTSGTRQNPQRYETQEVAIKREDGTKEKYIIQHYNAPQKTKAHSSTHGVQSSKRRKVDKVGKGLRHFSMKVCEKVKEKGSTTYNEVADELVAEEIQSCNQTTETANCDQKNIRRRVYDALNVLMAMNIILKDKKEIRWIGLPTSSVQQIDYIKKENQKKRERIERKKQELKELILQQISFQSLVERNKQKERNGIVPTQNSSIQLPFIIVNTHKTTKINCSVSTDKSEYYFKFNDKFEIHDDVEVLKRMGLLHGLDKGQCTKEDIEKAKSLLPKVFGKYIEAYGRGEDDIEMDEWDSDSNIEVLDPSQSRSLDQSSDQVSVIDEDDCISESSDVD